MDNDHTLLADMQVSYLEEYRIPRGPVLALICFVSVFIVLNSDTHSGWMVKLLRYGNCEFWM